MESRQPRPQTSENTVFMHYCEGGRLTYDIHGIVPNEQHLAHV